MPNAFHFGAGPGKLPEPVLQQAREALLSYSSSGVSVLELPHRGAEFLTIVEEACENLSRLLHIPNSHRVLFLQGGATAQFDAIPRNLLGNYSQVDYVDTGLWSQKAMRAAAIYATVHSVARVSSAPYIIPDVSTWSISTDSAYLHYTDNETITGLQFSHIPDIPAEMPLVSDMSSSLLAKPIDVSRFGLIYASAQKNISIAGLCVVIVREDLLQRADPLLPDMLCYRAQVKANSIVNTPPMFPIYLAGLNFQWLLSQGGLAVMAERALKKSHLLYSVIDRYADFYRQTVAPLYRSQTNIVFHCPNEALDQQFVRQAEKEGLLYLAGHRTLGGIRASIYNAMPEEGVRILAAFMEEFVRCA